MHWTNSGDEGVEQIDVLLAELESAKNRKVWDNCVEICREASSLASPTDVDLWYAIQINLGIFLLNYAEEQSDRNRRAASIDEAIAVYERLLAGDGVAQDPVRSHAVHRNIAYVYSIRISGDRVANLRNAIRHYEEALCLISKSTELIEWAVIGSAIGLAYSALVDQGCDPLEASQKAMPLLEEVLEVFTKDDFPSEWSDVRHAIDTLAGGMKEE